MRFMQFLIAYFSFSVLLPLALVLLGIVYRLLRPKTTPVRDCRYCGAVIPATSSNSYCSADCEGGFQQVRNEILMHATGRRVHGHV